MQYLKPANRLIARGYRFDWYFNFIPLLFTQAVTLQTGDFGLSDEHLEGLCKQSVFGNFHQNGGNCQSNGFIFKKVASSCGKRLLEDVVKYAQGYLELESKVFTISGSMRNSVVTETAGGGNGLCGGSFNAALIGLKENETGRVSVRLPRIFFVRGDSVHIFGIVKEVANEISSLLYGLKGWFYRDVMNPSSGTFLNSQEDFFKKQSVKGWGYLIINLPLALTSWKAVEA